MSGFGYGPPGADPRGTPPLGGYAPRGHAPADGRTTPDGQLAHIPFTAAEAQDMLAMARWARLAAIGGVGCAGVQFVCGAAMDIVSNSRQAGGNMIGGAIACVLAILLLKAATAIEKVVRTDEADQRHLASALDALKYYFVVKGVLWLLGMAGLCCLATLALVVGGAIAAVLGLR